MNFSVAASKHIAGHKRVSQEARKHEFWPLDHRPDRVISEPEKCHECPVAEPSTRNFTQKAELFQGLSATRAQESVDNRRLPPDTSIPSDRVESPMPKSTRSANN